MDDSKEQGEKRTSPKTLADRADDGFVSLVRTAGNAVRRIEASSVRGVSRIARSLKRDDESAEEHAPAEEVAADAEPTPSADVSAPAVDIDAVRPRPQPAAAATAESAGALPGPLPAPAPAADARAAAETSRRARPRPAPARPTSRGTALAQLMVDAKTLLETHPLQDRIRSMEDLRPIVEKLLHGPHEVRRDAKRALARKGLAIAEPIFVAILRGASPELTELALEGLADTGSDRLRGCVAAVIAAHDPEMRLAALRAAQQLGGEQPRPFFAHAALDADPTVRRRAVLYLSWRDSDWAAGALRALCEDRDERVRWSALRALATTRPAAARELLRKWPTTEAPLFRRFLSDLISQATEAQHRAAASAPAPAERTEVRDEAAAASPPHAPERPAPAAAPNPRSVASAAAAADSTAPAAPPGGEPSSPAVAAETAAAAPRRTLPLKTEGSSVTRGRSSREGSMLLTKSRKRRRRPT